MSTSYKATTTGHKAGIALNPETVQQILGAAVQLLAEVFSLYIKSVCLHRYLTDYQLRHWHISLENQADHISAMTSNIAECAQIRCTCLWRASNRPEIWWASHRDAEITQRLAKSSKTFRRRFMADSRSAGGTESEW